MTGPSNKNPLALLFAGHMVDMPDRPEPRFPPRMEPLAAEAIEAAVQNAIDQTGQPPVAVSSVARGGDILFLETCRRLGLKCRLVLPFPPETFVEKSVEGPETGRWTERFWEQWDATLPDNREVLSDISDPDGPYAACNRRLIQIAKSLGDTLHLITLWNGATGDGPGGTAYMVDRVKEAGGSVDWIGSNELLKQLG